MPTLTLTIGSNVPRPISAVSTSVHPNTVIRLWIHSPATVMPSMRSVGDAMAPRNSRSLPISAMLKNMSFRLPATVISSTGIGQFAVLDPQAAGAAREIASHQIDAEAEELGDEQPFLDVRQ